MVYLVTTESLKDFMEKKVTSLTAKDRFVLICFEEDKLPVSVVSSFQNIKAKFEVKTLKSRDPEKDKYSLAFNLGLLSERYKKEGEICMETSVFENIDVKEGPTSSQKVKKPVKNLISKKTNNSSQAVVKRTKLKSKKQETPIKKEKPAKTGTKTRNRLPNTLANYLIKEAGPEIKELATKKEKEIRTALIEATDAKIGLKTKLQLLLLNEDGWEKIWEVLSKNFDQARKKYGNE